MKATSAKMVKTFKDIPNIGPAMISMFQLVGVQTPADLKKRDPYLLYMKLNKKTGKRYDPCVLDVFMSAIDFMNGAPPHPWWHYTTERKKNHSNI